MAGLKILFTLLFVTLVAVACGGSVSRDLVVETPTTTADEASSKPTGSVVGPPDSDWVWQLTGVLDTSVDVDVWDVDLFETGAAEIGGLQAAGGYVICYFSAGSIEDWRPDVGVIEESAIGLPLDDWPGENWLDIVAEKKFGFTYDN